MGKLLGPGGVRLECSLRPLCTIVWPVLYQVLTLQDPTQDPLALWSLPKEAAIQKLPPDTALRTAIQRFYQAVRAYHPAEDSLEQALAMFESGVASLEATKSEALPVL